VLGDLPSAQVVLLLGEHDNRAAFGGLIRQAGQLGDIRELRLAHPLTRQDTKVGTARKPNGNV
jgi:hypothetical protein